MEPKDVFISTANLRRKEVFAGTNNSLLSYLQMILENISGHFVKIGRMETLDNMIILTFLTGYTGSSLLPYNEVSGEITEN